MSNHPSDTQRHAKATRPLLTDRTVPVRGLPSGPRQALPLSVIVESIEPFIVSMPFAALAIHPDGRVASANQQANKIFRTKNAKGMLASAVLRQPELLSALDRITASGAKECIEFTVNGETETWRAHMRTGPESKSVVIMFEDMTAVRRAERARADFLANASHELRTPLTAIAGFIETMRGPARNDKDSWDGFLEIMQQQTDRMRRLVTDLLSLSRIEFSEHDTPENTIELTGLLQKTGLALKLIARDCGVCLQMKYPDFAVHAIADSDEMIQVIQNLIDNAIKYSPPGSTVGLFMGVSPTMSDAKHAGKRRIDGGKRALLLAPPALNEAPAVWIQITDDGPGIPQKHLPRLGERFYRVDKSRGGAIEGTGLGLAIVKHIMTRHKGGFAVESRENKGTAFNIWMPRLGQAPQSPQTGPNHKDTG